MPDYELTPDAEVDLHDIALYTLKTWGLAQMGRYEAALESNLKGIGVGETLSRPVFEHRSDIRVSRCEHHYVFVQMPEDDVPLIVAVLHEKMDLLVRLRERRAGLPDTEK